ncbi:AAA family ATPase [Actinomyces vulturis]|uniref:AAA family ATPase n=1 Tax=Actinomyces vulturis TaxID=1857645 RepID=UPI000830DA7A|nr:hypothetical protein [Actinomyces vulturis]
MKTPVALALWDDDAALVRAIDSPDTAMSVIRRCADVSELLAAVFAGLCTAVVLDTRLDGVDTTVIERIERQGVRCLLLAEANEQLRLASSHTTVLPHGASTSEIIHTLAVLHRALSIRSDLSTPALDSTISTPHTPGDGCDPASQSGYQPVTQGKDGNGGGDISSSSRHVPPPPPPPPTWLEEVIDDEESDCPSLPWMSSGAACLPSISSSPQPACQPGRIVVVWGPHGAPGRSTIAASLAHLCAQTGPTVLVDADTEAPSQVQALAMPDDSSGLATACRLATHGRLDHPSLAHCLIPTPQGFDLMTGVGRQGRWRELPTRSLDVVWNELRNLARWIVVDVSGGYENPSDDGFGTDTWRYGPVESLLCTCDDVVMVGKADVVNLRRLITFLSDTTPLVPSTTRTHIVVNQVPRKVGLLSAESQIRSILNNYAGITHPFLIPADHSLGASVLLNGECFSQGDETADTVRALRVLGHALNPDIEEHARVRRRWARRGNAAHACRKVPMRQPATTTVESVPAVKSDAAMKCEEMGAQMLSGVTTRRAAKGRHRK